jgi:Tfp pilus assembly protein PilN
MSGLHPTPRPLSEPASRRTPRPAFRRDLQLDFLHQAPATPTVGWVLLSLGIIFLIVITSLNHTLAGKISQERQVAARLAQLGGVTTRTAADDSLLQRPWGSLFLTLEQSRPETVALIQLEASGQNGQLSLLAETQSVNDMLDYVKQLRGQPGFSNVTLVRHTTLDNAPERPIQFAVRLGWAAP